MNSNNVPLVFIHIGDAPPDYAKRAVLQARRWNPNAPIFFLSSAIPASYGAGEEWISIDSIPKTYAHIRFLETSRLNSTWRGGFWRSTTERLFILEDWMLHQGIKECIHMENDIMLYTEFNRLLPVLRKGKGLSTTFQGQGVKRDQVRVCFAVLYVARQEALSNLLVFLSNPSSTDEMQRGGDYWDVTPEDCSLLPTAPVGVTLISETYRSWYENPEFPVIFDAAAYGQYLGGIDPRNGSEGPGFVNLDTDFRTDQFQYIWRMDSLDRRYPVLQDKDGREWNLANLHIHSKELEKF